MSILEKLKKKWNSIHYPFLIHNNKELFFSDISKQETIDISEIQNGDVVAVIGDFNPQSILTLLKLIDKNVILVPLFKQWPIACTRPYYSRQPWIKMP